MTPPVSIRKVRDLVCRQALQLPLILSLKPCPAEEGIKTTDEAGFRADLPLKPRPDEEEIKALFQRN